MYKTIAKLLMLFLKQCIHFMLAMIGVLIATFIHLFHVRGEYFIQLSPRLVLIHISKK
ncbi:hypothetical protein EDD68_12523 [Melghiribacillus thermohalophilus]|uniref:Uncharacterized protein n=1 Tax=Melghiribacillus thermohalophilus TaxID=1324956 RepID=A0A4R3MRR8_9BACI|nr:hypothetical protein [Melghiribacillus thermohalophilus]TCT18012.1 hypothetical protein EDD68_12523 [Melghiribacillus thermohalophilus]